MMSACQPVAEGEKNMAVAVLAGIPSISFEKKAKGREVCLCGWEDVCAFLTDRFGMSLIYQLTWWIKL